MEDRIATVDHVFNLQGAEELSQAQERYLGQKSDVHAIILAASRGSELHELTHDKPKAMLSIGGKTLLGRLMEGLKKAGINKSTAIAGYKAEAIDLTGIEIRINEQYESSDELSTLVCAQKDFNDDMVIVYGDLLFREYILRDLLKQTERLSSSLILLSITPIFPVHPITPTVIKTMIVHLLCRMSH